MLSEREFIEQRLAIVEEYLEKDPPKILQDQRQYDDQAFMVETNRYELEAKLLHHILSATTEGKVLYALQKWKTKFHRMSKEHYNRNKDKFSYYENWNDIPFHLRQTLPQPSTPPSLRYSDQYGNEWIIDGHFLGILESITHRLNLWLTSSKND